MPLQLEWILIQGRVYPLPSTSLSSLFACPHEMIWHEELPSCQSLELGLSSLQNREEIKFVLKKPLTSLPRREVDHTLQFLSPTQFSFEQSLLKKYYFSLKGLLLQLKNESCIQGC